MFPAAGALFSVPLPPPLHELKTVTAAKRHIVNILIISHYKNSVRFPNSNKRSKRKNKKNIIFFCFVKNNIYFWEMYIKKQANAKQLIFAGKQMR
jgi:hypothetical protein